MLSKIIIHLCITNGNNIAFGKNPEPRIAKINKDGEQP